MWLDKVYSLIASRHITWYSPDSKEREYNQRAKMDNQRRHSYLYVILTLVQSSSCIADTEPSPSVTSSTRGLQTLPSLHMVTSSKNDLPMLTSTNNLPTMTPLPMMALTPLPMVHQRSKRALGDTAKVIMHP